MLFAGLYAAKGGLMRHLREARAGHTEWKRRTDFKDNSDVGRWVDSYLDHRGYSHDGEVAKRLWINLSVLQRRGLTQRPELIFALSVIDAEYSALAFVRSITDPARGSQGNGHPAPRYLIKEMAEYLKENFKPSVAARCGAIIRRLIGRPDPAGYIPYRTRKTYARLLENLWLAWYADVT